MEVNKIKIEMFVCVKVVSLELELFLYFDKAKSLNLLCTLLDVNSLGNCHDRNSLLMEIHKFLKDVIFFANMHICGLEV